MPKFDIAVIGGDKRLSCMASVFARRGYQVICYGTLKISTNKNVTLARSLKETVENAPIVVCGIPLEKNGYLYFEGNNQSILITELHRLLRKNQKIFAGVISPEFRQLCEEREIGCYDFMKDEPLTIYNAVATAEGAILEALLHKDTQLHQSQTLVLGYGRCGKVLSHKLSGLSACVTVCSSDSKELALAGSLGYQTQPLAKLSQTISSYEYIFNTIPTLVLPRDSLICMNKDCLVIDIASNRVGVDYEAAHDLSLRTYYCPGLPGKYCGQSCGKLLADYVMEKCN